MYLTGAITPADRAVVVRHLTACADCRAELAGLAGLPALLRRPPVQAAAQDSPADDTMPDYMVRDYTFADNTFSDYPVGDE
ncbi:MAG TPA: zf-HC2 domain-containing protein, partial [Streptosporangiaceae bacterium]|nr:zf-HC2 domain-containing protein [Streptosporangiaceae bacterium]